MARIDSSSLISPQPPCPSSQRQGPPIAQHPNPSALTCRSDRPSVRWNVFVVVVIYFSFRIFLPLVLLITELLRLLCRLESDHEVHLIMRYYVILFLR